MKTTVVPAQITTVEDRIAGSFTFIQIVLLIIPLILSTAVYVAVPPHSGLSSVKVIVTVLLFSAFGALAIRIRGKLVLDWLVILLRFSFRPHIYVFTKSDITGREVEKIESIKATRKSHLKIKVERSAITPLSLGEQSKINTLFDNPSLSYRFEMAKKGGIDVSLTSKKD
jgi:hypothetical protein